MVTRSSFDLVVTTQTVRLTFKEKYSSVICIRRRCLPAFVIAALFTSFSDWNTAQFVTWDNGVHADDKGESNVTIASATSKFAHLKVQGLPNAIQVNTKVISGGQPDPLTGFQSLQELGVKTIVSVDGIEPNVEAAIAAGMRYIHLPVGYQKIPEQRAKELAHAILVLKGPIYIHCHHGRHRSPAAAAVGCVTAGLMSNDQAKNLLINAGTSPNYRGLFQSAQDAQQIAKQDLTKMSPDLPAKAEVSTIVEVMVHLDEELLSLKSILDSPPGLLSESKLQSLSESSSLLADEFTELLRRRRPDQYDEGFLKSLKTSQWAADQLQQHVLKWNSDDSENQRSKAKGLLKSISRQCTECHRAYRNND